MPRREEIRSFICEILKERNDSKEITCDTSLIHSGRVDSMDLLKVIVFLESNYGTDFSKFNFDPNRFDTVTGIDQLVEELAS